MEVIEVGFADLAVPEAVYGAVTVIPGTFSPFWATYNFGNPDEFEDPSEALWATSEEYCENVAEDKEIAGEPAETESEEKVVKSFSLGDDDEPFGLPVGL